MSIATSTPFIKAKLSPSPTTHHVSKLSSRPTTIIIRSSKADGPLRRPGATPSLSPPPPPMMKPTAPSQPAPPKPSEAPPAATTTVVTLEYQRKVAKELQEYFRQKKLEQASQGPFFGFVAKNEISNGRWAMFGFSVGMLTEYATGSDFVQQVKILLSNFGIVDLD